MYAQDIPTSAIQPRDHDDFIGRLDAAQSFDYLRIEHQPRFRCALVRLARGGERIIQ
jgi:hypothetical protein